MRSKSWKFIAALSAVIVLVSVVGSYNVEADGSRLVYVESDGYLLPSGFTSRYDVDFRHSFKRGFSARIGPKALKELSLMKGVTISDVPMLFPSVVPADQIPYGVEQIYDDPSITATSGGAGITIAHLDTGVFTGHPDLANRIVGCLDATNGMAKGCTDKDGHGSKTAGTAVADGGDGTGVYGVAPEAGLFVIKVCIENNGGCAADDVAAAINHIGNNNLAHIVTMSFGGNSSIGLISDAIADYPNILFVAAAGNDGPKVASIDFPARDVNVIAVGAIDSSLTVPNFSSRGIDDGDDNVISLGELEFAAAGVSVISTFNDGGYRSGSGTSMSTPHIAGLAAREWQGDAASTRAFLRGSAQDILLATGGGAATGFDVASGYGLPHVSAAPPPPPPVVTLDSIQISPTSASIMVGETQQFDATAFYSDNTEADVTDSAQWDSSNGSVASIDGSGLADGLSEGNSSITATLDGVTSSAASLDVTAPAPPPVVTLDSIQVSPSSASIMLGETQQFDATAFYSDNTQADVTGTAQWDSSNGSVASIDGSGLAEGLSEGNSSITATLDGVTSNPASLDVTAPAPPPVVTLDSIQVSPTSVSIMVGDTQQFGATAFYSDDTQTDVSDLAQWDSSNGSVASIDGSGMADGLSEGNSSITATLDGVTSNAASLDVTAPAPPPVVTLDSIQVSPSNASIMVGETRQFDATAFYSDSTQADVTDSALWDSSNGSVATIDGSGLADGQSEGNTSITATIDGVTSNAASLDVTAPPPPPATVMIHIGDLDGKARTGKRGWKTSIKIVVLDSDGNTVSKANVSGTWTLGTFSCNTNGKGRCTVRTGNIDLSTTEVMFRVTGVSHSSMEYDSSSNTDPEDDSDGTAISVLQPPTVSKNSDNHGNREKGD